MKRFIAAIVISLAVACAAPAPIETGVSDIVGFWAVAGTNSDGTTYDFEAVVEETPAGYAIVTYFDHGNPVAGCGLVRSGNSAAVGCEPTSIAVFVVEKDRLVGEWIAPGLDGVGKEVWIRIPELTHPAEPSEPSGHEHTIRV